MQPWACVSPCTPGCFWKPLFPQISSFPNSSFPGFLIYLLLVPIIIPCSIRLYSIPLSLNVFSKCQLGSSSVLGTLKSGETKAHFIPVLRGAARQIETQSRLFENKIRIAPLALATCTGVFMATADLGSWAWQAGNLKSRSTLSPQCSNFLGFPLVVVRFFKLYFRVLWKLILKFLLAY